MDSESAVSGSSDTEGKAATSSVRASRATSEFQFCSFRPKELPGSRGLIVSIQSDLAKSCAVLATALKSKK